MVGAAVAPTGRAPAASQREHDRRRRRCRCTASCVLYVGTVLQVLLTAGLLLGWAPLEQMLQAEGIFAEVCSTHGAGDRPGASASGIARPPGDAANSTCATLASDSDNVTAIGCEDSQTAISVAGNTGMFAMNVVTVLAGVFRDRCGPRSSVLLGSIIAVAGFWVAEAGLTPRSSDGGGSGKTALTSGLVMIGVGGRLVYVASLHVGKLFRAWQGVATSVVAGTFGVCAIVFAVMRGVWSAAGGGFASGAGSVSVSELFHYYAFVLLVFVVWSAALPQRAIEEGEAVVFTWRRGFEVVASTKAAVAVQGGSTGGGVAAARNAADGGVADAAAATGAGALAGARVAPLSVVAGDTLAATALAAMEGGARRRPPSLRSQVLTWRYLFVFTFLTVSMWIIFFYLVSHKWQLRLAAGGESAMVADGHACAADLADADAAATVFGWVASLGGLFGFAWGFAMDRWGMHAGAAIAAVFGVAHVLPPALLSSSLGAQYVAGIVWPFYFEALLGFFFTYVGSEDNFDQAHFGALTGIALTVESLLLLLLPEVLTMVLAADSPAQALVSVNVGLLCVTVALLLYPAGLYWRRRRRQRGGVAMAVGG